jgi:hypothetical protein
MGSLKINEKSLMRGGHTKGGELQGSHTKGGQMQGSHTKGGKLQGSHIQNRQMQGDHLKSTCRIFAASILLLIIVSAGAMLSLAGCRQYDNRIDVVYFFKTDPEKAVLDFINAINNHDAQYIYTTLLPDRDKRSIDKDKFVREIDEILADVENIEVNQITYLGYENEMSKVVIDFNIKYANGTPVDYRKYIYLLLENGKWKIVFDKTFI